MNKLYCKLNCDTEQQISYIFWSKFALIVKEKDFKICFKIKTEIHAKSTNMKHI